MPARVILTVGTKFCDHDLNVTLRHRFGRRENRDRPAAIGDRNRLASLDLA